MPKKFRKCGPFPRKRNLPKICLRSFENVAPDQKTHRDRELFAVIADWSHCYQYHARSSPNVLLERLQPLLTRQRRPQQSGFMPIRWTIDAILALRLLAELHREFGKPLQVAYIDIKAAFDSVDCQALWKALHATGTPQFLIQLMQDLHTGTTSRVRVGGSCQKHFILPLACDKSAFSTPHDSVWQSIGSCPDAPTISALHLVMQCSQTLITPMMRYFLHKTQEGGRQTSSVSTNHQPPLACTLHGKWQKCWTSVTVPLLNHSPSTDILWLSRTSLFICAAMLTRLAAPVQTSYELVLHLRWWVS